MTDTKTQTQTLPPRWFIRSAWAAHRGLLWITRDRVGLARPREGGRFGMLRLHTTGRKSGLERAVIVGYIQDGDNLVSLAMNGWHSADPAWWKNLQHTPAARVDLLDGTRVVRAREATGEERERLWDAVRQYRGYGDLDALAEVRGTPTAVVVLEPEPRR